MSASKKKIISNAFFIRASYTPHYFKISKINKMTKEELIKAGYSLDNCLNMIRHYQIELSQLRAKKKNTEIIIKEYKEKIAILSKD